MAVFTWLKRRWILIGLLVAVTVFTCGGVLFWRMIDERMSVMSSSCGSFGHGFWWREQEYSILVGWPKEPASRAKPAIVLLLHWPNTILGQEPATRFNYSSSHSGSGVDGASDWKFEITGAVQLQKDREIQFSYSASGDEKQPTEKFEADGKVFDAEDGRVFLVDMTSPVPTVVQLRADLETIVRNPATIADPNPIDTRPVIREALAKLRGQHPEVRAFLEGSRLK